MRRPTSSRSSFGVTKGSGESHPGRLLIVTGAVAVILLGGSTLVKSDMDIVKFFPQNDSIRISDRVLNEKMAGTKSLAVILDSDLRDPVTRTGNPDSVVDLATPEVLKKVDQFAADVKATIPLCPEGHLIRRRPEEDEPGDERRRPGVLHDPRRPGPDRPVPGDLLGRYQGPADDQP